MKTHILRNLFISKDLIEASGGNLRLGVVFSKVQVTPSNPEIIQMLSRVSLENQQVYSGVSHSTIPQIEALRTTYTRLGVKTSKYKGSNESLLKRSSAEDGLYYINNVVDINNYVSLSSLRSIGSYDLSKLVGNIEFRKGMQGETYIGTTKRPLDLKNLPVLCDDQGPFGSPTSDSNRALIQESTTDLMTVIFSFDGNELLEEQLHQTAQLLSTYANAHSVMTCVCSDDYQPLVFKTTDHEEKFAEVQEDPKIVEHKEKKASDDLLATDHSDTPALKMSEYTEKVIGDISDPSDI